MSARYSGIALVRHQTLEEYHGVRNHWRRPPVQQLNLDI